MKLRRALAAARDAVRVEGDTVAVDIGHIDLDVDTFRRLLNDGRPRALDPLQETVHRALMALYARLGQRGAALRKYQECVNVVQRELGVEPEVETRELCRQILQRRPAAPSSWRTWCGYAGLRRPGRRRLR
jgi:hypothetical protein